MRRFLTVAFVGLAVTVTATAASAQGRQGGRRAGVPDSARMAIRQHRLDSLRAAGVLDSNRAGRLGPDGGRGGRGRAMGPMGGRAGLMGLQLNDNEKAAVKTISDKYRTEYEKLREANKDTPRGQNPQAMAQMKDIAEREQAEIRGALTAEHQAQFDASIAKRKERAEKGKAGRRGQRPPAAIVR